MEFRDSDDSMICVDFDTHEAEACDIVNSLKEDDFVAVKFLTKITSVCYVRRLMDKPECGDVKMQFLLRKGKSPFQLPK